VSDADVNAHYIGTRLLSITEWQVIAIVDTHNAEA